MSLSAAAKNVMLDNLGITVLSLHTGFSSIGGNEISGGSPGYARMAVSFAASSGGVRATSTQPVFNVPPLIDPARIRWIGKWIGATFGGMSPNGGLEREFFVDASTDIITCYAHGYPNAQTVVCFGDTVPGGLIEGQVYFVINATTDTFQVSLTQAGTNVNITSLPGPACVVSKIVEEQFASQGTATVTAGSISLNA